MSGAAPRGELDDDNHDDGAPEGDTLPSRRPGLSRGCALADRRFGQEGDVYFALLTVPFWRFCAIVAGLVLLINAVFAWVYMLNPGGISNARPGSFEDAFFFSVQTLATIGYGTMAPQTRFAHVVVTIESMLGIIAVGSLAGISFARLSRPKALVLFSSKAVVRRTQRRPSLCRCGWRIGERT
jgi:hypothetical protein